MQCKNVISKLQRRIEKEGPQIVPLLTDLWKRGENSGYTSASGNNILDLRKIDLRVDRFEYNGVMELVFDVQLMLKSSMQHYGFSHEVCLHIFICVTTSLHPLGPINCFETDNLRAFCVK